MPIFLVLPTRLSFVVNLGYRDYSEELLFPSVRNVSRTGLIPAYILIP